MTTTRQGDECLIVVDQQQFLTERFESAALLEHLRSLGGRSILLRYESDTPYRCVGSAIFMLQRADETFRVPQMPTE